MIASLAATVNSGDCRQLTAFRDISPAERSGREVRAVAIFLKLMSAGSPVGRGSDGFDIGPVGFDAAALEDGGARHQHVGAG